MRFLGRQRKEPDPAAGATLAASTGATIPVREDDIYHGILSAAVAATSGGTMVESLRQALGRAGVEHAVLVAVGQMRRDEQGRAIFGSSLRIVRRGGAPRLGAALNEVLAAGTWTAGMFDTVEVRGDHPILHDPDYAIPLIPSALPGPRQPLPAVDRSRFTPLAHSGIRNTYGLVWFVLSQDPSLGRLALGVRDDGGTYELLAECSPVTIELLIRAMSAVHDDHRVHRFAIRPVNPGDPALEDESIVVPLRRYPDAPRSLATILGEALPIGSDVDLAPTELEAIRAIAAANGAVRASVVHFETRSLLEVQDRVLARDPVTVVSHVRRLLVSRNPTLLFAEAKLTEDMERLRREDALRRLLEARLGDRAPRVAVTATGDPLLDAAGYSIPLL